MTVISKTPEQTMKIGTHIGRYLQKGDIIALQGTLAAGKTTLTKGIAQALKITEDVTSPTFPLITEYHGTLPLYHMDTYRLDSTEDFLDLGTEELLYGSGVCVIEWSEKIMEVLPSSSIIIKIEIATDGSREISVQNWPYGALAT